MPGVEYANRVLSIEHIGPGPATLYRTEYEWNPNNTIATRTETDNSSGSTVETVVTFGYDDRDRLIRETRVRQGDPDVTEYDIEYLYDDLGNRLQKSQTTATESGDVTVVTDYVYDITEPNQEFVTNNNRLMYYTETVDSELRRTVYYTYYETGDVSNITIKDESDTSVRKDLALTYARNGGLWLAVWGEYAVDGNGDYVADSYVPTLAREFRYESARGRYMSRDYTTNGYTNPGLWEPATAWTYTEYVGDTPIADWEVDLDGQTNEPVWTKLRTYLPGSSAGDAAGAQLNAAADSIQYYHGDLVGSTVATTDADGQNGVFAGPAITVAYTAFGELVANDGSDNISIGLAAPAGFPRYQYCGAWGYEAGPADGSGAVLSLAGDDSSLPPINLMHVGARWYEPALGRFVQRDPIGLQGEVNVYAYGRGIPIVVIDPTGLESWLDSAGQAYGDFWMWVFSPLTTYHKPISDTVAGAVQVLYVDPHQAAANILTIGYAPDFSANMVYPMSGWAHRASVNTSQLIMEAAMLRYGVIRPRAIAVQYCSRAFPRPVKF